MTTERTQRIYAKHVPEEAKALYAAAASQKPNLQFSYRGGDVPPDAPTTVTAASDDGDDRIVFVEGEAMHISRFVDKWLSC
jgi:hypothetical protein